MLEIEYLEIFMDKLRPAELEDQDTFPENSHSVGDLMRAEYIVCRHQDGLAPIAHLFEKADQIGSRLGIQIPGRLIQENCRSIFKKGDGNRKFQFHPRGKLLHPPVKGTLGKHYRVQKLNIAQPVQILPPRERGEERNMLKGCQRVRKGELFGNQRGVLFDLKRLGDGVESANRG